MRYLNLSTASAWDIGRALASERQRGVDDYLDDREPSRAIAALIAKALEDEAAIVALRAQLEEADRALLFWRGYPEYIFSSDMEDGEPKQAVKNALAREAERQKGNGEL